MTKKQLQELVAKNRCKHPHSMIDTATGLEALQEVVAIAESNGVEYALVGGIAMHLYGSLRWERDVDVIASAILPLPTEKRLGVGGAR